MPTNDKSPSQRLFEQIAENTRRAKTKGWTENFICNMPRLAKSDHFGALKHQFAWVPAVCVAAGCDVFVACDPEWKPGCPRML